jgi:hypothetical protein
MLAAAVVPARLLVVGALRQQRIKEGKKGREKGTLLILHE